MNRTRPICGFVAFAAFALLAPSLGIAADLEAGKQVYNLNCVTCHGPEGKGDGPVAAALPADSKPRDFSKGNFKYDTDGDGEAGTDEDIKNIIQKGAAEYGGNALMAPLPHLSDQDIENVIAYVRSLEE